MMNDALRLRCPAKLNFGLEVVGTRSDGYHEIRTIFQAIDLADDLEIEPAASGLHLRVQGAEVPDGAQNLVLRAAELLRSSTGVQAGARLALHKRIPPGAGLGGGSSDAAVTLLGLDELWGTRLGPRGLEALAGRLGADVPYFLHGGACLGLGRGDKLVALEWDLSAAGVIVVCPKESLSTAQVYADWDAGLTSSSKHSKLRRFLASVLAGEEDWEALVNDLEGPAGGRVGEIGTARLALIEVGARAALMSGSGPCVFGIFPDLQGAQAAMKALAAGGRCIHRCRVLSRAEYRQFIGMQD